MSQARNGSTSDNSATTRSIETMTRSGVPLTIRRALPADLSMVADIYAHLTAQDLRFRFGPSADKLGQMELAHLLDQSSGMFSFLATSGTVPVACATLLCEPGHDRADIILSVRSDWKGRGVSWTLLEHVLERASEMGLKRVSSVEPCGDRDAINLQREMGFVARLKSADPLELSLVKSVDT